MIAENPKEFNSLVEEIINNPEERDAHIKACYETVMKNHTYKNRVEQIIESFEP